MGIQIRSIKIDQELCTGCHICVLICSFTRFRLFNPRLSSIRIEYNYKLGRLESYVVCNQCGSCVSACSVGAMRIGSNGVVHIDYGRCNKCLSCVSACPNNAFTIYNGFPYKCDLCGGDPQCARFCVTGALHV